MTVLSSKSFYSTRKALKSFTEKLNNNAAGWKKNNSYEWGCVWCSHIFSRQIATSCIKLEKLVPLFSLTQKLFLYKGKGTLLEL